MFIHSYKIISFHCCIYFEVANYFYCTLFSKIGWEKADTANKCLLENRPMNLSTWNHEHKRTTMLKFKKCLSRNMPYQPNCQPSSQINHRMCQLHQFYCHITIFRLISDESSARITNFDIIGKNWKRHWNNYLSKSKPYWRDFSVQ